MEKSVALKYSGYLAQGQTDIVSQKVYSLHSLPTQMTACHELSANIHVRLVCIYYVSNAVFNITAYIQGGIQINFAVHRMSAIMVDVRHFRLSLSTARRRPELTSTNSYTETSDELCRISASSSERNATFLNLTLKLSNWTGPSH